MQIDKVKPCRLCGPVGSLTSVVVCDNCKNAGLLEYCLHTASNIPEIRICDECYSSGSLVKGIETRNKTPHGCPNIDFHKVHAIIDSTNGRTRSCIKKPRSKRSRRKFSVSWKWGATVPSTPITLKKRKKSACQTGNTNRASLSVGQPQSITLPGARTHVDAKTTITGDQRKLRSFELTDFEKYPSNRPNLDAIWKGKFEILDEVHPFPFKLDFKFQAHLPRYLRGRTHKFPKTFPEVLKFNLLPRPDVLNTIFQDHWPVSRDISLYFFPHKSRRSINQYLRLVKFIEKKDLVMMSSVNDIDLIVFTSKDLYYSKELNWAGFFWGFIIHHQTTEGGSSARQPSSDLHND